MLGSVAAELDSAQKRIAELDAELARAWDEYGPDPSVTVGLRFVGDKYPFTYITAHIPYDQ